MATIFRVRLQSQLILLWQLGRDLQDGVKAFLSNLNAHRDDVRCLLLRPELELVCDVPWIRQRRSSPLGSGS